MSQPPSSSRQNTPIPPLRSIRSTIFVPIPKDFSLTGPFNPPANRIERLRTKLDLLETQRNSVRASMLALYRRECARLIQETIELEAGGSHPHELQPPPRMTAEEEERNFEEMLANVTAKVDDSRSGGVKPESESTKALPAFNPDRARSLRERQLISIQMTLSKGLSDLIGYDEHIARTRNRYLEALEREKQSAMDLD